MTRVGARPSVRLSEAIRAAWAAPQMGSHPPTHVRPPASPPTPRTGRGGHLFYARPRSCGAASVTARRSARQANCGPVTGRRFTADWLEAIRVPARPAETPARKKRPPFQQPIRSRAAPRPRLAGPRALLKVPSRDRSTSAVDSRGGGARYGVMSR